MPDGVASPSTGVVGRALRSPALRAALGGVLVAASAPPFPPAFIAAFYVGLLLFAAALEPSREPSRESARGGVGWRDARCGALRGFLFGFGANVLVVSFVPVTIQRFTELPLPAAVLAWWLLAAGQAAAWAVTGLVTVLARRRVPLPLAFGLGMAASFVTPQLFPWTVAGPLARAPVFLQLAEVVGERGVAVLLAISAGLAVSGFASDGPARRRRMLAAAGVPTLLLAYGLVRMSAVDAARAAAPRREVALIQQAVPPKDRWRPENAPSIVTRLWTLTKRAQDQGADLAIWPESAYPYVLPHGPSVESGPFRVRGPGIAIEVITGALTHAVPPAGAEPGSRWQYNATVIVDREGRIAEPSAKIELLAFGETVPFGDQLPWLRRTFARSGGLVPGTHPVLLETRDSGPRLRAGILNCYEDTLPGLARRVAGSGPPNVLVNVTNDAWFDDTPEPELHLLEAIPRAIEARRDLLRAVNTGVTAHVDAVGRVVARAPRAVQTLLLVEPALLETPPTPYVRFGDAPWAVACVVAVVVALGSARARGGPRSKV